MPEQPVHPVYIRPEEAGTNLDKPPGKRIFLATVPEPVTLRLEPGESLPLHINHQAGISRRWNNAIGEPADLMVIKWQ